MKNRISNISDQFINLLWRAAYWIWETIELILIIIFDCLARLIELVLVMMRLIFQVICFVRDLCIDTMQTFANVFRGIVNVISNISCDDVEDFASACIVIALCTGAVKMFMNLLKRNRQTRRSAGTLNRSCACLARNTAAVGVTWENYGAKTRILTRSCSICLGNT
ncbi:PREDICTED: uncharacterized protein LOC108752925 isoform X2 [Trachymyrmex septentrionalis]|uniref:uncharacterized protein LOC108752925 isoform X2 n=1 Tax=Trachymyrmex septentrionalis TaxID=34720 RepID=UPI00084EDDA5|nr:PREDICTED: uncharacterized protein LOC108752925 isoform X2 [Trachymyrmex septentrionalis]